MLNNLVLDESFSNICFGDSVKAAWCDHAYMVINQSEFHSTDVALDIGWSMKKKQL